MPKSKSLKTILILALLSALFAGCSLFETATTSSSDAPAALIVSETSVPASNVAEGHLVPAAHAELSFVTGGQVLEYAVAKGDSVTAGQVLVTSKGQDQAEANLSAAQALVVDAQLTIDQLNQTADLQKAQADQAVVAAQKALIEAQNNLDEIDTDQYQTEVDNAKEKVNDLKSELEDAQEAVDDVQDLNKDSQRRKDAEDALEDKQAEYDQAARDYELLVNNKDDASGLVAVAEAHLADAKLEQRKVADGPNTDQLSLAQANLDKANAQLKGAQAAVEQTKIVAPFDGSVYQTYPELGEYTSPGSPVIVVVDDTSWFVETDDLTELTVVNIEVGDELKVAFDALPEKTYTGTVEEISRVSTTHLGDVTYTIRVSLPEIDPLLRWGMTASVFLP